MRFGPAALFAAAVVAVATVVGGCGSPEPSITDAAVVRPTETTVLDEAIRVRERNGLRADRTWVEEVERDPSSLVRLGIRVTANEALQLDTEQVRWAMQQRARLGMRSDEAWVRAVEADPGSIVRLAQLRVTLEEAAFLDAITAGSDGAILAVIDYRDAHPQGYAGHYLDGDGVMNVLYTTNVVEHRTALSQLFAGTPVIVREVQWTERDLLAMRRELRRNEDFISWLRRQGWRKTADGIDTIGNKVHLEVETEPTERNVAQAVIARLDAEDWLTVDVVVADPPWAGGHGDLTVRLVGADGSEDVEAWVVLLADPRNALEQSARCYAEPQAGRGSTCQWKGIGATTYVVQAWRGYQEGFLGSSTAEVEAGEVARLTLIVPTN